MALKISQAGLDLIKSFESFSPCIYTCPAGKPTIGYGHLVRDDEHFTEITEAEACALLAKDCAFAEDCLHQEVTVPLSQLQFDALVSLVFNIGCNAFCGSTLLMSLNKGNYERAAGEFDRWIYANGVPLKGLIKRREKEKQLFLAGSDDEF